VTTIYRAAGGSGWGSREGYPDGGVSWLTIRTRNLLKLPQNWRAVEELAAALVEREEIGAAEAKGIIRRGARAGYEGLKAARK
jgi:hypothetical protein